jgi:hypothetical protein
LVMRLECGDGLSGIEAHKLRGEGVCMDCIRGVVCGRGVETQSFELKRSPTDYFPPASSIDMC